MNIEEEIKKFEHKWGEAPEWAYERLKKLSKEITCGIE